MLCVYSGLFHVINILTNIMLMFQKLEVSRKNIMASLTHYLIHPQNISSNLKRRRRRNIGAKKID